MPELIFFRRGDEVLRVALDRPRVVIGRGDGCDVVIPDPEVSRQQLALTLEGEQVRVEDLSGKGIQVAGEVTQAATLSDGADIVLGHLDAELKFDKGAGKLEKFHGKGDDLEVLGQGTLKLARRVEYSEPNVDVKLKAEPAFVSRLGLLGSGLSMLPADREAPGFRVAHLSGFLGQPSFLPGR
jgi:type II secretion system protein N